MWEKMEEERASARAPTWMHVAGWCERAGGTVSHRLRHPQEGQHSNKIVEHPDKVDKH